MGVAGHCICHWELTAHHPVGAISGNWQKGAEMSHIYRNTAAGNWQKVAEMSHIYRNIAARCWRQRHRGANSFGRI